MFCPKCATQNLEGASFCRSCGANISLISDAMLGPPTSGEDQSDSSWCGTQKKSTEPRLDSAFRNAFMGIAFLFVAIALSFSGMGRGWWFWMLIPAFSMMGTGVAQYIRLKEYEKRRLGPGNFAQPSIRPATRQAAFPTRNTGELVAPPSSVTEGTTRHLGAEVPTRHFDVTGKAPK
ncbi:MAG TPA: zinc-ribbon domain-containing protein [Pyrinomonadaceae bacterium]|nr:zinc-ribbon domain-containing protein [Pyrinomonadaceae bacterium]